MKNTKDNILEKIEYITSEEEYIKSEYRRNKARYEEFKQRRKKGVHIWGSILISIVSSCFLFIFLEDTFQYRITFSRIIYSLIWGSGIGCFFGIYIYMLMEMKESRLHRYVLEFEAESKEDIFENSIKMSYKYLDQYYLQTREQAQRGFFVTVCVAIFGAILIGVGIGAMFLEKTEPSYVTCASGVITEFIAAIFFYLYNKTISSMSNYHNKLVLSQNISIALKVADTLPSDDKVKAKNTIIKELLKDINSYLIQNDLSNEKMSGE